MLQKVASDANKAAQDSVDNMKLSKYGFNRSLIGSTAVLSWLGIVSSVVGILGGVSTVVIGICEIKDLNGRGLLMPDYTRLRIRYSIVMTAGSVIILSNFIFVLMWIHLKRRTTEKDIFRIEETAKTLNSFITLLEVIMVTILIAFFIISLATLELASTEYTDFRETQLIWIVIDLAGTSEVTPGKIVGLAMGLTAAIIYLVFAFVKICAIQKKESIFLEIYIRSIRCRQILLFLEALGIIAGAIWVSAVLFSPLLVAVTLIFIFDNGLIIILHSIRVNRESPPPPAISPSISMQKF